MPHDEALGLAQSLLTLLVFVLGILIAGTGGEARIRHVLQKRSPHLPLMMLVVVTFVAVALLVWFSGRATGPLPVRYRTIGVQPASAPPGDLAAERVFGSRRFVAVRRNTPIASDDAPKLLIILLVVAFGFFALVSWKIDTKWLVVWRITGALRRRFHWKGSFRDEDVADLLDVGEHSVSDYDKSQVVTSIHDIGLAVIPSRKYGGTELSSLIVGLARVVESDHRPGREMLCASAAEIMEMWWQMLNGRGLARHKDAVMIIEMAAQLGEACARTAHDVTAMAYLDVVPNNERIGFRIGRAALSAGRHRLAVAALQKLATITERQGHVSKELLALLAEFTSSGAHAAAVAAKVRRRLDTTYSPAKLHAYLLDAADEFSQIGEFAAADVVRAYAFDYR